MRVLRLVFVLYLTWLVGIVQAQPVHEAISDQDLLVDLTVHPSVAYQVYAYETYLEVEHRFLGEAFDLNMTLYDANGQVLYDGLIEGYTDSGVEVANDEYLVLFYITGESRGRALVRFNTAGTSHDFSGVFDDIDTVFNISDWSVSGEVVEPIFIEDKLCAQSGDGMWFFSAPQPVIEQIQTGYGNTFGFGLEQLQPNEATVVWLIVGNGLILEYSLDNAGRDISYHTLPLRANAGWVDADGSYTEEELDGELFQEFLNNVTQVLVQGSQETCLLNPSLYVTTSTAPHVPYYVFTYDVEAGGLPSGCDGYIVEQSTGIIYSDDPAENIRISLEALFSTASEGDLINHFGDQGLTVENVTVEEGFATIEIGGNMMQIGSCVDGAMETQILLSVFHNAMIEGASIRVNGSNMKPQFDMSDMTPEDAIYTPADFSFRLYTND
jgi:hypothetical protein